MDEINGLSSFRQSDAGVHPGEALRVLLSAATAAFDHDLHFARECIVRARTLIACDAPGQSANSRGGLARWQAKRVTAYIDSRLDSSFRVSELAQTIDLSASHFSRAFRQSYGMSPQKFIAQRRITRAQHLMRNADSPLSQIALECGLCDQSHFTRMFRRVVGVSPRTWRRDQGVAEPAGHS